MAQTRGDRTRAALLRATTQLVAEVGYHQATTRAIAERAGVSEGTIYRHYPDKRTLFTTAVLEEQKGVSEWMSSLPARAGSAPVLDLLTEAFLRLSELRATVLPMETALAQDAEQGSARVMKLTAPELAEAMARQGGPPTMIADYLAAEQRRGRIRADLDPVQTTLMLMVAFYGLQTSPLAGPDGLHTDTIGEFARMVLHGIAADRPPPRNP